MASPSVPVLCPGGTVVCLGGGPSLTPADVDYVQGKATVIAVNDAYRLAPWADVLYAADAKWWDYHEGVKSFAGLKFALQEGAAKWGVAVLKNTGERGIETDPTGLRTGRNSGYQAVNVAVHLGATQIVLLGYDMHAVSIERSHWFGAHPPKLRCMSPYEGFRLMFATAVEPLAQLGISVINCSRETALECFPRQPLREVL